MRGAAGAEQRAPQARVELRPEDGYLQLVCYIKYVYHTQMQIKNKTNSVGLHKMQSSKNLPHHHTVEAVARHVTY